MKFLNTLFLSALAIPALAETVDFHRDVAPILREYCVGCHNNDDLEGELSVETFQLLMKGGENGSPIKAGDRAESLLAKVITKQAKPYMPPRREPQLSPAQVDTLLRWIDQGAKPPADDRSILANLNVPEVEAAGNALSPVTALAIGKNGQLVIGRYGAVQIGDKSFSGIHGKVNAIAISPDEKTLAVAGGTPGLNGVATLFKIETGKKLRELAGHRDALYGIAFSPDGNQLATADTTASSSFGTPHPAKNSALSRDTTALFTASRSARTGASLAAPAATHPSNFGTPQTANGSTPSGNRPANNSSPPSRPIANS